MSTHVKFVGGLVPEEGGKLPRGEAGELVVLTEMKRLCDASPVKIQSVQIPAFPGVDEGDNDELINGLKRLDLVVHLIMMVGGADPMNPDDEDAVVEMLTSGINVAKKHGIEQVSSTSIEEWMKPGAAPKTGTDFDAAVAQNAKVHSRVYMESGSSGQLHQELAHRVFAGRRVPDLHQCGEGLEGCAGHE